MGSLKPGATYIYERVGERVYAREFGKSDRKLVSYGVGNAYSEERKLQLTELNNVLIMCETDPVMQAMLEQLFVMYNLKKTNE